MADATRPSGMLRIAAAGLLVAAILGWWWRPAAHPLPDQEHGDRELASELRELTKGRPSAAAAGVVVDDTTRVTSIGAPLDGTWEIGSISKALTGMLYVDAVARGEVEPATTLGEVFDLGDAPAAAVRLEDLSRHASGLPRQPGGVLGFVGDAVATLLARDPDGQDLASLLADLRDAETDAEVPTYSNLGFAVLGHAIARRAGRGYDELVAERIAEPLGLNSLTVPAGPDRLGPDAVTGRDSSGRIQQPWAGPAMVPAGGVRADIEDLTELARLLLAGQAPGMAALDPVADLDADRIGAGWIVSRVGDRVVTWHNGGTGGFRAWLGLDRDAGTAAVVVAATSASVDEVGRRLLAGVTR